MGKLNTGSVFRIHLKIASLRPGYSVVIEPEEGEDSDALLQEVEDHLSLWGRQNKEGLLGPVFYLSSASTETEEGKLRIEVRYERRSPENL